MNKSLNVCNKSAIQINQAILEILEEKEHLSAIENRPDYQLNNLII